MSGSNSSAPDSAAPAEVLEMTVHALPPPRLDTDVLRVRHGRLKMLLVLLVCAAPVIASYLMYFVVRPEGRVNYGSLITPTRALPALPLHDLDGHGVDAATLKGQWLLLAVGTADCTGACQKLLFTQRQLREMLGRERERVDKVWFVTGGADMPAALRAAIGGDAALHVLRVPRSALAAWLSPAAGHALEDHLYVVDPMGEWMMRMPADPDPAKVKRDLARLLSASSSWDLPGR